jgi:hypothetical protein
VVGGDGPTRRGVVGKGAEESGRSERAPIASGGGMRRRKEARVSEEAVGRKDGEGGPRKLGMGYGEAEEPV